MSTISQTLLNNYQMQIQQGDITQAYKFLLSYVMQLKADFSKQLSTQYTVGNVSPGYMDFTYFPFSNDFLKAHQLRFGIVLNHRELRFELWLMGRNADVQKKFWALLKTTPWNTHLTEMPQYSVLESVLIDKPNFIDLQELTEQILSEANTLSTTIINEYLKNSI